VDKGELEMATAQFVPSCEFDAAYITGLRAHDPTIESHFVEYFSPILQRKLRRNSSHWGDSSDIQQETFTRVLTAIQAGDRIQRPERLGAFVMGVCNNVLFERWRSALRYQPLAVVETKRPDDATLPHDMLVRGETARHTQLVLSRLSRKNRRLLQAVFMEEMDRDEICKELSLKKPQLRILLLRAKRQFLKEHNRIRGRSKMCICEFLSEHGSCAFHLILQREKLVSKDL
jgi:RNA polymerase sigma-70 factor (ECF subfamily)